MAISFFTHMTASHFQNATNFKAELSDGIFTFEKCDADTGGAISVALVGGDGPGSFFFFFFGRWFRSFESKKAHVYLASC